MPRTMLFLLMALALFAPAAQARQAASRTPVVAVLNFGPAEDEIRTVEPDFVGVRVCAQDFRDVVPVLQREGVTVVVVRIRSNGGYNEEADLFAEVLAEEFLPKFRTVAWVENAVGAAARAAWVFPEIYVTPEARLGPCQITSRHPEEIFEWTVVEEDLRRGERLSALGKRDPRIMRSMQITEPLSARIDESGAVTWTQSAAGPFVVNPRGKRLSFDAESATKFGIARAVASTRDELAAAMGYAGEVVWGGQESAAFIEDRRHERIAAERRVRELYVQVSLARNTTLDAGADADQKRDQARKGLEVFDELADALRTRHGMTRYLLRVRTDEEREQWLTETRARLKAYAEPG